MTVNGQVEESDKTSGSQDGEVNGGAVEERESEQAGQKSMAVVPASGTLGQGPVASTPAASVTNIARRAAKPVASGGAVRTTLTTAELDKAREEIITKELPSNLPGPIKTLLRKLLPEEILQFKSMMELVYTQAATSAGQEGYERGKMEGDAEGLERGKAGMLELYKPMVAVVNAADSWVDNLPRMSEDKPGTIENQEAAQAAITGLVEAVMKHRQTRLPPA